TRNSPRGSSKTAMAITSVCSRARLSSTICLTFTARSSPRAALPSGLSRCLAVGAQFLPGGDQRRDRQRPQRVDLDQMDAAAERADAARIGGGGEQHKRRATDRGGEVHRAGVVADRAGGMARQFGDLAKARSEERRVGKEGRWWRSTRKWKRKKER